MFCLVRKISVIPYLFVLTTFFILFIHLFIYLWLSSELTTFIAEMTGVLDSHLQQYKVVLEERQGLAG